MESNNPGTPADQPINQPQPTFIPPSTTQPERKRSLKMLILLAVALLLLVGGIAYILYTHGHKKAPVASTTNQESSQKQSTAKASPYFYLAPDTKPISVYNPETKTKSTIAITVGENEALTTGDISTNKSVQMSSNGQIVAYSTAKQKDCGEGGCEITDTFIYVKNGDKTEQIVKIAQPQMLDDWVISTDGSSIFYLINKGKTAGYDLHKITTADKKDTLIKQTIFDSSAAGKTPMFVLGNDSFRIYDSRSNIKEYSYENGSVTSRDLAVNKFCSDCRAEYGQPLSPDGKTLILESGNVSGTFSYYSLNLTTGDHKQIVKTAKTTEQLLSVFWSPDSKSITYDITANGSTGQNEVGLKFRFEIYDIASGKTTAGFADPSPGVSDQNYNNHFVNLLGWSPDGDYIAFLNDDTAKLYKLADGSTIDSGVGTDSPISSNVGYGWYTK